MGGESVRFNINAHCFAVEPSGWRFALRVNSLSSLFRRFAPSDSPRVHQITTATAVVFVYGGRTLMLSATCRRHTSRRRHIAFAEGKNIASFLLRARFFCFLPRKNRPGFGRFFSWIYYFLLNNASVCDGNSVNNVFVRCLQAF